MKVIHGNLGKFSKLDGRDRLLFTEALLLHLWVGLMLKIVPFRWVPRLFSTRQSVVGDLQLEKINLIKVALQRAGNISPWKNRCLVSSLAGRCMLSRRKIISRIFIGVAKSDTGSLVAHAWLNAGNFEIIAKNGEYRTLYTF